MRYVTRELWPLSWLDHIKLARSKPVCQQSWQQGRLPRRTRHFFPGGGHRHCLYSLLWTTKGCPGWVGLNGVENIGMVDPPKVVTCLSTVRAYVYKICVMLSTDAYDREFRGMYEELPPRDKARMRVADRAPNAQTVACRRLFGNLEFWLCTDAVCSSVWLRNLLAGCLRA